ncbi:hypothetical protein CKM354_000250500 [Cercospora kikuchii]|uniref:Uncharacterized protein n=1 Tax=Cercospora kikuchii TaxID=84275 RepID=A0A9P3C7T1_9PEZI|nr:uncharacterized protein CKM354_000250500 [Cercospora kikuchii]GIZ39114.1 hypothetical protein CKM354_000250500 [Cercospora kikuchii]
MPPLGDAARGGSEPSKISNSAPSVGHSSTQDDVSTIGPELTNRDVNTTDNVWTRADAVRFVLLTIKIYCSGSPEEVQDFITGSAMSADHSAEPTVIDPISDSSMSRHSGNFTEKLRTKGDIALFILVTIKANLPHDPDFEAHFEHRLHDTTPLSGQEDFDVLSDEEFAWYRKFLNFQLERFHKAEEKSYARLSRDPELNRISTMRNGGFTWIEVSSPESAPNYGAGMAVESPADDLCYDSTSGVIIRRMRTVWIANTPTGADPEAYVLFTVPSSGRDSLHADDRDKCIEVIHSSDARALNPKGVVDLFLTKVRIRTNVRCGRVYVA